MSGRAQDDSPGLALLESVRCLDCGTVYAKPVRGGTVSANPGCPSCGYVGWLSVTIPMQPPVVPSRSAWDPQHRPTAQSG